MAVKKFLTDNGKQAWPITRVDCIYTLDGSRLLSDDYLIKEDIDSSFISELEMNKILYEEFKPTHSPASFIKKEEIEYDIGDRVSFDGDGDYIDTNTNLFDNNSDWSLLIDFTDRGHAENVNSLFILHNFYENDLFGFNIQKTGRTQGNVLSFQINNNYYKTKTLNEGVNTRLVITFKAPNTLEMYFNDPDLDHALGISTSGYFKFNYGDVYKPISCNLYLACWYNESEDGVGRFWRGDINEFVTWKGTILSEEEIQYILRNKEE